MIRAILIFILLAVIYQAVRILFHSALRAAGRGGDAASGSGRLTGAEMVQDPQCRTFIVKERAVVRRIGGEQVHFCSAACADEYERTHRP